MDLRAIYCEIFSSSRARQGGLRIALPWEEIATWGIARSLFGSQEKYLPAESLAGSLQQIIRKKIDLMVLSLPLWMAHPDFKKNGRLLQEKMEIFLQKESPAELSGTSRSPLPPYWVIRRRLSKKSPSTPRSGWIFFEAPASQKLRAELQKIFSKNGWDLWTQRIVEHQVKYSNRQTWRCGVEWKRVWSPSDYRAWQKELKKLPGYQFDLLLNSEQFLG